MKNILFGFTVGLCVVAISATLASLGLYAQFRGAVIVLFAIAFSVLAVMGLISAYRAKQEHYLGKVSALSAIVEIGISVLMLGGIVWGVFVTWS